jgi:glycosyltransferase involved in cell wall biosynthesis
MKAFAMKVLFDHPNPFMLAHGGFQLQIEQTKRALEGIGVEVEWLKWWDSTQTGEVIHYFGRPSSAYIDFAHQKGLKVVMSELLTGLGSRSAIHRRLQKSLMRLSQKLLPGAFTAKLAWDSYQKADAIVALTPWEKQLMVEMFNAPPERVHVIPNGVEEVFFRSSISHLPSLRADYLVCTSTITERKRVLELAEAAILAQTPLWIIGTPYAETVPYYLRFLEVVKKSGGVIRYEGGISDRQRLAEIYRSARGFVLLSTMESLSISALEATASGCPLLLSDLPWARSTFGNSSEYCPSASKKQTARLIAAFYRNCPNIVNTGLITSWTDVGRLLEKVYSLCIKG